MDIRASVQIFNAYTTKYQAARAFCNAPGCCRLTVQLSGETTMKRDTDNDEWGDEGRTGPDLYRLLIGIGPILVLIILLTVIAICAVQSGGG